MSGVCEIFCNTRPHVTGDRLAGVPASIYELELINIGLQLSRFLSIVVESWCRYPTSYGCYVRVIGRLLAVLLHQFCRIIARSGNIGYNKPYEVTCDLSKTIVILHFD